jgi:predicted  nucleic acid-binding Zn-ribbon protein
MSEKVLAFSKYTQIKKTKKLRLIDTNKLATFEKEVEILREQIDSLKQILHHQSQKLHETEQELRDTNNELSAALNYDQLTLDEAKELAKNILSMEKPARDALAEFLSSFYHRPVKAEQF